MEKKSIRLKQRARKLALQALYQWMMSGEQLLEIETQFRALNPSDKADSEHFSQLLYGIPRHLAEIEAKLAPLLDRKIEELSVIENLTLNLATYELLYCPELPYRIVLDEYVTLTKTFGTQEGHRYVNGILNNLAKILRPHEQ